MERKSFLDQKPPPGYVPGIGRGASGFTTRSDLGSVRPAAQLRTFEGNEGDDVDTILKNNGQVDESGLLSSTFGYSKEDEEADAIYKQVDERMKSRNKKRHMHNDENEDLSVNNLTEISNQFVDLKKNLSAISEDQWANLPEVGDLTKRNKRQRQLLQDEKRTYAAPDSLLAGLNGSGETESSVDLSALTSERQKLLNSKIDANFDFDSNDDVNGVDKSNYLTEISGISQNNDEEIKKIRTILSSFTKADPKKPEGWIARARLEEFNKKFDSAKKVIQQGCTNCPHDEEIWLENIRLNASDVKYCKIIITEALNLNNKSLKLWLKAVELEQEIFNKKRVLRKAIENLPLSSELWLKNIELEDDLETNIKIANKAIELIPNDENLWLKLISLQDYSEAKKSLNSARKALPKNIKIWICAIKLEHDNNFSVERLTKLVKKAYDECNEVLSKEEWYKIAIELSDSKYEELTTLIVERILTSDEEFVSEDELYAFWNKDSETYKSNKYVLKAILNQIAFKFPKKVAVWKRLISLYKASFDTEQLFQIFEKILKIIPKNPLFWLMYSKEVWKSGDIAKAKEILNLAIKKIPNNVDIWCALIKLERIDNFDLNKILTLFKQAKEKINNERINYKYITFLRQMNEIDQAITEVDDSLQNFPHCFKFYLIKSQILIENKSDLVKAREILSIGTKQVPESIELWINLAQCDILSNNITRARSDLDLGILKNASNANCDKLWLCRLELEKNQNKGNNEQIVNNVLNKAIKLFPKSSYLWEFNLRFNGVKKSLRKTLYQDALNATDNHERILLVIGSNFWVDGKFDKAKRWFERAISTNEDFGDSWAWYFIFLTRRGIEADKEEYNEFISRFKNAEPRHGDIWTTVSKKIENIDKDPEEVLQLVGKEILNRK